MRHLIIVLLCVGLLLPSLSVGSGMLITASNEARPQSMGLPGSCRELEAEDFATDLRPQYSVGDYIEVPMADIEEGVEVVAWSFAYDKSTGVLVCSITLTNNSDVLLTNVEWEMTRTLSGGHSQDCSITCRTAREVGAGDTVTATARLRARLLPFGRLDKETLAVRSVRACRVLFYC